MCLTLKGPKIFQFLGEKINFFNLTNAHENESSCSIQTWDLSVGRSNQQPLCHRDRQQSVAM